MYGYDSITLAIFCKINESKTFADSGNTRFEWLDRHTYRQTDSAAHVQRVNYAVLTIRCMVLTRNDIQTIKCMNKEFCIVQSISCDI